MNKFVQTVDSNSQLLYEALDVVEPTVIQSIEEAKGSKVAAREKAIAEVIPLLSEWFTRPSIQFRIKTALGESMSSKKYRELRGQISAEGYDWKPIAEHYIDKEFEMHWTTYPFQKNTKA